MSKRSEIAVDPAHPEDKKYKGFMFIRSIPDSTKHQFKAACSLEGISMRDAIMVFMRAFTVQAGLAIEAPSPESGVLEGVRLPDMIKVASGKVLREAGIRRAREKARIETRLRNKKG